MNSMNHRTFAALALSTCTLLGVGLGACSSDKSSTATSDSAAGTTDPGATETTDPGSLTTEPLGGSTTAPPTTPAPTAPPTTPAPSGPKVKTLSTPDTSLTCDEAAANGNQATVSWSATNAASVSLSIDGPGAYATGLPATGSYDIPASCMDTQVVLITAYDAGGNPGGTKSITITITVD